MKKLLTILICTAMLTGCGGSKSPTSKNVEQQPKETKTASTPTPKADKGSENVSDADIVKAIEEYVNQDGIKVTGIYNTYSDGEISKDREGNDSYISFDFRAKLSDIELLEVKDADNGMSKAVMMCSISNDFFKLSSKHRVETSFGILDGEIKVATGTKITSEEKLHIEPTVPWDNEFYMKWYQEINVITGPIDAFGNGIEKISISHDNVERIEIVDNGRSDKFNISGLVVITFKDGRIFENKHTGIKASYSPNAFEGHYEKYYADKSIEDFEDYELWGFEDRVFSLRE